MDKKVQEIYDQTQKSANAQYMKRRRVAIDPITRLEGHGKIDIFLNDQGDVDRAYLQIP
ncbi:MAG: Ni/Fe hydrogenase subunit alpha, partial [Elusimicrobia bacterium]|nr:Ni/Fe hydrogenase subunit alpha [Elusimicrobiota bacterium]